MEQSLVSIIIPAHDEEKYVANAIRSIWKQTAETDLEIIVVANACKDTTAHVANEEGAYVIETNIPGAGYAKNIGASEANGSILIFMDADSRMDPELLNIILTYKAKEGYNCGKAKIRPGDDDSRRAKLFCYYSEFLSKWGEMGFPGDGAGALMFVTRKMYEKLLAVDGHLFDDKLRVMEDVDLINRMKEQGNYKFIRDVPVYISMRRFREEGYITPNIEDTIHGLNPKGKTRARWNVK